MRILLIAFALFWTAGLQALSADKKLTIENEWLVLQVDNNKLRLTHKQLPDLNVQTISVPGAMLACSKSVVLNEMWGDGEQIGVRYNNGRLLTFSLYARSPFVHIHTVMENTGDRDVEVRKLYIASIDMTVGNMDKELNVLGTGGLTPARNPEGSFAYTMLVEPDSRHSILTAWLTQKQGVGLMTPVWDAKRKVHRVTTELEFGNYLVRKGQSRNTDVLLIGLFADGREGLELYGDHLAKAYQIRLPERPEVYCTWYHRNLNGSGASTEKDLFENARFVEKNLAAFGLNTFQIDDHWQSSMIDGVDYKNQLSFIGDKVGGGPLKTFTESNANFPSGMPAVVSGLRKRGIVSGVWFMPFAGDMYNPVFNSQIFAKRSWTRTPFHTLKWSGTCIDATHPEGEAFLRERFRRIHDWGFRYFKVDGLHTGAPSENLYVHRTYQGMPVYGEARLYDDEKTFVECFRKGLSILKEEAPETFILGCCITQNMSSFAPAFGLVDAMRVGPDNDKACEGRWSNVTSGADYAGNLYFLNNKVWYNDPDPYYVRESNPLNKARWMVSWQSIAGVMSTTSMQYAQLPPERLDLIKRGLPTHRLSARPVDILEKEHPEIWLVGDERMHTVGLFNWKEKEPLTVDYAFERMGLDGMQEYELFDFWENKYLGKVKGRLTLPVDAASCRVLSVRSAKDYPQVLSTSRHITQGLVDIESETWDSVSGILSGSSRVVKGDRYEWRVIIPDGFVLRRAVCDGRTLRVEQDGALLRISYTPGKTGSVAWRFEF